MPDSHSHILIVDDNPENIRVLGAVLRQKNYRVTITQNGELALKAAEENVPDLILLDIMMPGMNGFQVCEALKNNPKTKEIEVIFVTAAITHDDELKGLALGAVDYIHKPFSVSILQSKVALHLERAHRKKEMLLKNAALEENAKLREHIDRITRHDLKNPLNALLGYPQLMLLDPNLTPTQHGYLEKMLTAGNEMLHMINSSLDLFKMEMGDYQYRPELLDMLVIIKRVLRDLRMLTEGCRIRVKILVEGQEENDSQSFQVLAESSLSYSLLANLICNAIEASTSNDTITIAMYSEEEYGVIAITNSGSVPEAVQENFFEKYSTAGKAHGTGLGTYSAKLMTEVQHGQITMQSNSQQTTITVALPLNVNALRKT
jgi:two-component system, sensor histidine kinase and response regulator